MARLTFTKTDLALLDAIADGDSTDDIAKARGAKPDTVAKQIDELKAKTGASSREQALERFVEHTGWTNRPSDYSVVAAD